MKSILHIFILPPCKLYLFVFCLLGGMNFLSCKPDPPCTGTGSDTAPATPSTRLAVVWSRPFYAGGEPSYFNDPLFWGNYLVVSNNMSYPGTEMGVRMLDKATGEDHPAWNHGQPVAVVDPDNYFEYAHIGGTNRDILFTGDHNTLYAVDLNSGQRLWRGQIPVNCSGDLKFSLLGTSPLKMYYPSGDLSNTWCQIACWDAQTGRRRDLVRIQMEENYEFTTRPPAWTVAGNGDTLIFFLSSGWDFDQVKGKCSAYCYNVSQRRMEWENKTFPNNGNGSYHPPVVMENQVIFMGMKNVHCLDIATGELRWQYFPPGLEGYSETPPLLRHGKLYIRCVSGVVTCLDAATGMVFWRSSPDYAPAPDGRMDLHNGKLYLAAWGPDVNFFLYCLDADTGRELWRDTGPMGRIAEGVIIDQETGYLYCMSSATIICVDLNRTPLPE